MEKKSQQEESEKERETLWKPKRSNSQKLKILVFQNTMPRKTRDVTAESIMLSDITLKSFDITFFLDVF